jgi:hypothetical protein
MADPTTNYGWNLPDVAGDAGAWGGLLNTILEDIDDKLYTADGLADAALPLAGGNLSGHVEHFTGHTVGGSIATGSGTKTIDLSAANFWVQAGALSGAVTIDVTNPQSSSGDFECVILFPRNLGNASSVTWKKDGSAMTLWWQDGVEPTWTTSGYDVIVLFTYDGGSTWIGVHAVADPT